MAYALGRFVDRTDGALRQARGTWSHPQMPPARPRAIASDIASDAPRERYVDREFFDDGAAAGEAVALRRGSRVVHKQFGEGEVRSVVQGSEPMVMVAFPGRGEKKILVRFLSLA